MDAATDKANALAAADNLQFLDQIDLTAEFPVLSATEIFDYINREFPPDFFDDCIAHCNSPAMATRSKTTYNIPLTANERYKKEREVEEILKAGGHSMGAIVFTKKSYEFMFLPSEGLLPVPLVEQCPYLKLHVKDFMQYRLLEFGLQFKDGGEMHESYLFRRVLHGT